MEIVSSADVNRCWRDLEVHLEMASDNELLVVTLVDKYGNEVDMHQFDRSNAGEGQSSPQVVC